MLTLERRKPKRQLDAERLWERSCWDALERCIYSFSLSAGRLTLTRHGPVWDPTDRGLLWLSAFQGPGPAYLLPDGAEINSLPAENQWERRDLQDSVFPGIEVERSWDFRPSYKCIICFRCNLTGVIQLTAIMPLVWNEYRCVWGEESSIICFDKKNYKTFWQPETDRMKTICDFTVLKAIPSQKSGYPTVILGAISMETLCWNIILRQIF